MSSMVISALPSPCHPQLYYLQHYPIFHLILTPLHASTLHHFSISTFKVFSQFFFPQPTPRTSITACDFSMKFLTKIPLFFLSVLLPTTIYHGGLPICFDIQRYVMQLPWGKFSLAPLVPSFWRRFYPWHLKLCFVHLHQSSSIFSR